LPSDSLKEFEGVLEATGQVIIVVSRYHERLTRRLLLGALEACTDAGVGQEMVEVWWVDGAFELGVAASAAAQRGPCTAVVALGIVIRGETPHFDFVAGETSAALSRVALETKVPVGFGLLTCDTMEQAAARCGGDAGNKGREAAEAAIRTASLLRRTVQQ
jgi:6,7-dimethyl-8-ribityllumazine synthase